MTSKSLQGCYWHFVAEALVFLLVEATSVAFEAMVAEGYVDLALGYVAVVGRHELVPVRVVGFRVHISPPDCMT